MTEVVSSILGSLAEKLASSAVEEIQLVWGVKDDRKKLEKTLKMIQEVLADAEQKQTKEAAVRRWLSELKDFCYDAEDVVDEFETRALWRRARSTEHLTLKRKVRYLSSWLSNFIFQFKMAHKMKELRTRLDEINEEKAKFNLSSDVQDKTIVPLRETHSFVLPSNVIGRNEEKERIIELLMGSDDGGAGMMGVVPIIGMGAFPGEGIGCLTSLRWLFIGECKNLEALFDDIQSLTSLRKLFILDCPKLASLPQGIKNLKALEDLWIRECEMLRLPEGESNEPRSMSRLQSFAIEELPEIVSLPGWLEGSASTLRRIRIKDCPKLTVLPEWLQNCSSLRTLEIEDCPGLSYLPNGVRCIPTLTKLRISGCGELSSCGEEEEEEGRRRRR
ncbi:hypothetical protein NL676_016733 [Syzygium grande]|nr:hypothetical protein NL676_016733 [Syzygium grande]